jgi:hypothetical protein
MTNNYSPLELVGNARAAGMLVDIGLGKKAEAYNTSLALFFVSLSDSISSTPLFLNKTR